VPATKRERIPVRILMLLSLVALCSCDSDRFLSGQWTTVEASDDLAKDLDLHIELNLGHFGSDVVGVVRFVTTEKYQFTSLSCDATDNLPVCPCSRLNGTYKSNRETLYMELVDCDGKERDLVLHEGGAGLKGTLETAGGQMLDVEFEETKSERQLTTSDRSCDECQKTTD